MRLGLANGAVRLLPYDSNWRKEFEAEKDRLLETFGDKFIAIEHIGSTAIPGAFAKPIIDINVAISSLQDVKYLIEPLKKLGYTHIPQKFNDREVFTKEVAGKITHHLKLMEESSETAWKYALLFRDYLIANPREIDAYNNLKVELAKRFSDDRENYTESKSEFVQDILNKARP